MAKIRHRMDCIGTALKKLHVKSIVIAVSADTVAELSSQVDDLICLYAPADFPAVGCAYQDFSQTTDDDVKELLDHAERELSSLE